MRPTFALLVAWLASGCLSSETVRCGDQLCPVGFECTRTGAACFDPGQRCTANSECTVPDTRCDAALERCVATLCGDSIIDNGEVCDDGNDVPGDECSFACQSDESCGNGFVDAFVGEGCDLGVDVRGDGCDECTIASPAWISAQDSTPRVGAAAGHSPANGVSLLFAGLEPNTAPSLYLNSLLEWLPDEWKSYPIISTPPPIGSYMGLLYQPTENRLLAVRENPVEVWALSGQSWTLLEGSEDSPTSIGTRVSAAIALDRRDSTVLLFGGIGGPLPSDETWRWRENEGWSRLNPAKPPEARSSHAMAYDPVLGAIIVASGSAVLTPDIVDTWCWDGSEWTEVTTSATYPEDLIGASLVFDPRRGRLVLVGVDPKDLSSIVFYELVATQDVPSSCSFSSAQWSSLGSVATAGPATPSQAFYDTRAERVMVAAHEEDQSFLTTVALAADGSTRAHTPQPLGRVTRNAAAYNPHDGSVVSIDLQGTAIRGRGWHPFEGATPEGRTHGALAYSAQNEGLLLFGGSNSDGDLIDTWLWNGQAWTELTPMTSPPARSGHVLVAEPGEDSLLLFGGGELSGLHTELWRWNGSDWQAIPAQGEGPAPRTFAHAAYHPIAGLSVLFGGEDAGGLLLGDTWLWDGSTWAELPEVPSGEGPPRRRYAGMTYDANRQKVLLHGGDGGDAGTFSDTWELDVAAQKWTRVGTVELSPILDRFSLVYLATESVALGVTVTEHVHSYRFGPQERCDLADDSDGDGVVGCDDLDCWGHCLPFCPPGTVSPWPEACDSSRPHCGDGVCNPSLENEFNCSDDCPHQLVCGDWKCEDGEDVSGCPGDCSP